MSPTPGETPETSETAFRMAYPFLELKKKDREVLTAETIRGVVRQVAAMLGNPPLDIERVAAELERSFQIVVGKARAMDGTESHEPWLPAARGQLEWRFWNRYKRKLQIDDQLDAGPLERLDETTDDVLSRLESSRRPGTWDRRGMVVGHIQSGKTSHYAGLICKAADAGYKLIIVLAGIHNSLRSQTQIRLEEGFLGHDKSTQILSGHIDAVGVGLFDPSLLADSITTRADNGDFKRAVANNFAINPGGNPLLFVVKKNVSVLRNLLDWVGFAKRGAPAISGVPLLVIDDEADNASVDTNEQSFDEDGNPDLDHQPTALNQCIRRLLHSFDQCAYVGYTATPFANIFIHEKAATADYGEDLFPRSFILALPTPSTYVGPAKLFGLSRGEGEETPGLPIIRPVSDHVDAQFRDQTSRVPGWMPEKHLKTHVPRWEGDDTIPPSLREAIRAFVLVCAARAARAQVNFHNSMLVHVTRFIDVQSKVCEQLKQELRALANSIRLGERKTLDELTELWDRDFVATTTALGLADCREIEWGSVRERLQVAVASIEVRQINGSAKDVLDYVEHRKQGLNVIAVGGDKLSRGLTLEGLSISYFLRASKMYDTLMQMGRWFGYRPGYLDLCRLYTTPDLVEWFRHIAIANDELREDFDRMVNAGATPRDYGLRVKSHPQLMVTSAVKMKFGQELMISFDNSIPETINFSTGREVRERNWNATEELIREASRLALPLIRRSGTLGHAEGWKAERPEGPESLKWPAVPAAAVTRFLGHYQGHPAARKVRAELLREYVEKQVARACLTNWTVLLAPGSTRKEVVSGHEILYVWRKWQAGADAKALMNEGQFRIGRLVSPADEFCDLSLEEYENALQKTVEEARDKGVSKIPTLPSGPWIRQYRDPSRGLLILYVLDPEPLGQSLDAAMRPIVGFAISFPGDKDATRVSYVVNNVYWTQEHAPSLEALEMDDAP